MERDDVHCHSGVTIPVAQSFFFKELSNSIIDFLNFFFSDSIFSSRRFFRAKIFKIQKGVCMFLQWGVIDHIHTRFLAHELYEYGTVKWGVWLY